MKAIFERKDLFDIKALKVKHFIGYPPMFHTHCELIYVIKGCIPTIIDGKEHLLRGGELALVFPYLSHSYEDAEETEAIVLLFDPSATIFSRLLLTKKPLLHYTDGRPFLPLLERTVQLVHQGKTKTAISYLNAIIGELTALLPFGDSDEKSDDIVVKILSYCAEHFDERITIKQIAEALYISQSYISKIFSNKLKYNFRDYINALRIEKAKSLLEKNDLKIAEVMYECGFNNQSSFNRVFRNICEISPREFKKVICGK